MKQKICYCPKCKKATLHTKKCEWNGFERIFLGISTLGMAEIVADKWVKCEECGYNHDE